MKFSVKPKAHLILVLVVILVIAAAIGVHEYRKITDTTPMAFDRDIWRHNIELRHRMLDSLTENYELIGMSKSEIIALLDDIGGGYAIRRYPLSDRTQILFFSYDEQDCVTSWWTEHWY